MYAVIYRDHLCPHNTRVSLHAAALRVKPTASLHAGRVLYKSCGFCVRISMARSSGAVVASTLWYTPYKPYLSQWTQPYPQRVLLRTDTGQCLRLGEAVFYLGCAQFESQQ
jgi:hypothetical protein